MHAGGVACKLALGAFPRLALAKREHISTMAAPIRTHIGERIEAMGNAMVDLFLVRVCLCVRLADTLRHNLRVAFLMAGVLAVCTLHARSVFEEVTAEGAAHDVVECLHGELVAILFNDIFLLLTNGTLSVETDVERPSVLDLLDKAERELDPTHWF